jgi:hypothetical protein
LFPIVSDVVNATRSRVYLNAYTEFTAGSGASFIIEAQDRYGNRLISANSNGFHFLVTLNGPTTNVNLNCTRLFPSFVLFLLSAKSDETLFT